MIEIYLLERNNVRNINLKELKKYKGKPLWIDATRPNKEEFQILGKVFDLHPTTIEDCLRVRTRIKVEPFIKYLFFVFYGIKGEKRFVLEEIDFIIGNNFLISNHLGKVENIEELKKHKTKIKELLSKGPDFIFHHIVDLEIEQYNNLLTRYDIEIDKVERETIENPRQVLMNKLFRLRRDIMLLRRIMRSQQEKFASLYREDHKYISKQVYPYLRDAHDTMVTVNDTLTSFRETISNTLELYLTTVSNRMNEIMKVLAIMATFMLPLTVITGIYGMNFEFMPELHYRYGYFIILGVMVAVVIGLVVFFKKKGWM
ncbi:MAG: magnesium/cobalt transporter CorA [Nanoarchaeota archaeon]